MRRIILGCVSLLLLACAMDDSVMYPITSGSFHRPPTPLKSAIVYPDSQGGGYVVSVGYPTAEALTETTAFPHKIGIRVVERDSLPRLLEEQHLQLRLGDERYSDLLHVGKLVGADHVVFVQARVDASVSVRAVGVETGEVVWLGTARYPRPVSSPTGGEIPGLTRLAIARAICDPSKWTEWSAKGPANCKK